MGRGTTKATSMVSNPEARLVGTLTPGRAWAVVLGDRQKMSSGRERW